jgi:sugar/nucleoside kinase (ribokinase family)
MAHWIRESPQELMALVKEADTVFVSEEECALLGGQPDPEDAARVLLSEGAGHVVVKQGERGACLIGSSGTPVRCPAVQVGTVIDPTGAGDAFGGAFTATRSRGGSPAESLTNAAAAASLAIEGVSFAGFSESGGEFGRRSHWAGQQLRSGR